MADRFCRTRSLIGNESMCILQDKHVAIFGIGGVGGYVLEGLARSGVGQFTLVDKDIVSESNINRQIIALDSTIGMKKVDVASERVLKINPNAKITAISLFFNNETIEEFDFSSYDYVVDAIDTVSSKLLLIEKCKSLNIPIISCMGTGNKLNPSELCITDIYKTSVCPLAKVMRYELKKRAISSLKVCFSKEEPLKVVADDSENGRHSPASMVFVPASAGILIASEAVKDLLRSKT